MLRRITARHMIWAAIALGIAVRLVVAVGTAPHPGSDGLAYMAIGENFARYGAYGHFEADRFIPAFNRAPVIPWLYALATAILGYPSTVFVRLIIVAAFIPFLISFSRLFARICSDPRLQVIAAFAIALEPSSVRLAKTITPEGLALPALVVVIDLIALGSVGKTARATMAFIGLAVLLLHTRADLLPVVIWLFVLVAYHNWQNAGMQFRGWLAAFCLALATTFAACLPWSFYASQKVGHPVLIIDPKPEEVYVAQSGYWRWLTATTLRSANVPVGDGFSNQILCPGCESAFPSTADQRVTVELLDALRAKAITPEEANAEFEALARQRIHESPFSYYIAYPVLRGFALWLDLPRPHFGPQDKPHELAGAIGLVWDGYALLAAIGFLVCLTLAFARWPLNVLSQIILVRTFSLMVGGALAGMPLAEFRYLSLVEPLAIALALYVAGRGIRRLRAGPE